LNFRKKNKRKLKRLTDLITKGYIDHDASISTIEVIYDEELDLKTDILNFPYQDKEGDISEYGERVLRDYVAYLEEKCKEAGDGKWNIAPSHSKQMENQTKGVLQFLEGRKQGRPRKDYIDQLYQEIATLHRRDGWPTAEITQLIRNSNIKRKYPSEDVLRALERYPDNETLEQAKKHGFSFLEIQQLEENQ